MIKSILKKMSTLALSKLKKKTPRENAEKPRKRINRFDGLTEEEVQKYSLPDYLQENLDLVFVGINPSLMAAYRGRYYAGPGNHFYKLLNVSGLVPHCISFEEDYKLLHYGIGLTNIVERPTKSSSELKKVELKEGAKVVDKKLKIFKPKIAVFNGKCIYEAYANKSNKFNFGLQPETVEGTALWVVPSSSARCANFPRMQDKLHFYTGLKKYLSFLKGEIKDINIEEFSYEGKCRYAIPSTSKMWRRKNLSAFIGGGRIANKDTICLDTSEENIAVAQSTEFIVTKINFQTNCVNDAAYKEEKKENTEVVVLQDSIKTNGKDLELAKNGNKDNTHNRQNSQSAEGCEKYLLSPEKTVTKSKDISQKQKKVKRLSPKVTTVKKPERSNTLNFVNIIKERLEKKAADDIMDRKK